MKRNTIIILIVALQIALLAVTARTAVFPHFSNGYTCLTCHYTNLFLGIKGVDCLTCHKPGDPYGRKKAFTQADFADPFKAYTSLYAPRQYQSSHSWIANFTVPKAGALPPENPALTWDCDASAATNEVYCSRCHNVHQPLLSEEELAKLKPLLRMANDRDQMCLDCHRQRNTADHTKGTHPVNVSFTDPGSLVMRKPTEFRNPPENSNPANPTSAMKLINGMVLCTTCHGVHNTDGSSTTFDSFTSVLTPSAGYLLRTDLKGATATSLNICTNCHVKPNHNKKNQNVQCADCHAGHVDTADGSVPNVYLIRRFMNISTQYGKVSNSPVFYQYTGSRRNWNSSDPANLGVCQVCHSIPLAGYPADHAVKDNATVCMKCHNHANTFSHGAGGSGSGCGTATSCHGTRQSHKTHVSGGILSLPCSECHDINSFPRFKDGQSLANTTVCTNCHSTNGVALAKQYWKYPGSSSGTVGSWMAVEGEKSFCGSCHGSTPANTKGDGTGVTALNILGNDTTYGYYVTGHGKVAGTYARLAWQDSGAIGNPPAKRLCLDCHNLTSAHFGNAGKRLKPGYENDQNNSNCAQCHDTGKMADANPKFYTTNAAYEASAHSGKLCTECHEVHGSTGGAFTGMTKGDKQALCSQCHSNGGHPGVGTKSFSVNGKNYTLQCTSCHNVHVITGKYADAAQNKSPVSRFLDNTHVWGAVSGEKMNAYAGSGTYRKPNGELFTGDQLPDYATFCLDCHGTGGSGSVFFGINWDGDNHGRVSANQPNGYGTCPNWFACGKATGWEGDDCTAGNKADCWPVMTRGKGDQLFSRDAYKHTERIAGANFVLSCTDCHTGHGTGTLGRSNINGNGPFTSNWNNMCNRCHYYYSDWHAGMSCANASCHVSARMNNTGTATLHSMDKQSGSGGTRTFNPDLVLNYVFEGDLKDSGSWQMDGKWYSTAGSFAAGKSGQAAVLGNGKTVQVGTENSYWSTDEGYHGTWKYTEMKFNTTLESWVNPTDNARSEYTIFNKHVGINNGGYVFSLKKIGGGLKATFNMQADNNGLAQDGRAGIRGAYSSVNIPLNKWTHVSATFDKDGPDRNPSDPSAGRIRIYVNGVDVTTSDSSGNNMQPGANENSIYAYSENSPWNQANLCYPYDAGNPATYGTGQWCASEFSIGGFDWESTNFIGMIDDAKVWNVTKNSTYFSAYQVQAGPYISSVEGLIGSNQLTVTFSEGVYTNTGSSGALVPADFVLTDTGGNNPRTITGVTHTAGSATAAITMSAPLAVADVSVDTLAAATSAIYDKNNLAAGTETVTIGLSSQCPASPITLQFNEASGSTYVMDTQNILYGAVYGGASALTGSAYSGGGDGSGRYIDFQYNTSCLQADRKMTLETRIKPTGISGTTNYVRRILARDGNGNFQLSLWRNDSVSAQDPPSGVVMVALWVKPVDPNPYPATAWKGILTDYNACPIVNDHWYLVKAVWNSDATGIPVKIYVDDQGTDGNGAGESWAGYKDCTDSDQSQMTAEKWVKQGDSLPKAAEAFKIGVNLATPTNNLFNGLIDWITWKDSVE